MAGGTTLTTARSVILDFADRYSNPKARYHYATKLGDLFRRIGRRHPSELTEADCLRWCAAVGRPVANNTVRNRLSLVTTFLRWCLRHGHVDPGLVEAVADRDNPLRRVPRLCGKVQAKHPARWLTHDEAFGDLISTCRGDGDIGMRDELVLRLVLAGLRAAEIIALRLSHLQLDRSPPQICWTGKARRSRRTVPGRELLSLLESYLAAYEARCGRPLPAGAPVVCRGKPGSGSGQLSWGQPILQTCSIGTSWVAGRRPRVSGTCRRTTCVARQPGSSTGPRVPTGATYSTSGTSSRSSTTSTLPRRSGHTSTPWTQGRRSVRPPISTDVAGRFGLCGD